MLGGTSHSTEPSQPSALTTEDIQKVAQEGLPSFANQIMGRGAYMEAYKKQRKNINKKYSALIRKYHKEWRQRKVDLVKDLTKSKTKIEVNRYHLARREKAGDPRLAYFQRLSSKHYGQLEEHQWKQFDEEKRAARRELGKQRKAEHREAALSLREQAKSAVFDTLRGTGLFGHDPRAVGTTSNKPVAKYVSPRQQFMAARRSDPK